MYIIFQLPSGAGGQAALHYNRRITHSIEQWLAQNKITDYDIRTKPYKLEFTMSEEHLYTLFLLAWNEPNLPVPKLVLH